MAAKQKSMRPVTENASVRKEVEGPPEHRVENSASVDDVAKRYVSLSLLEATAKVTISEREVSMALAFFTRPYKLGSWKALAIAGGTAGGWAALLMEAARHVAPS